ncbi:sialidase family protein [Pseudactinotalea sp.]|uniref:sialidase family protein n=1 Tax=Pseudactinotalea sp. TaxID=1926260 RepID=UPI003B3A5D58
MHNSTRHRRRPAFAAAVAGLATALLVAMTPAASAHGGPGGHGGQREWSFEHDAVGSIPADCRTPEGAVAAAVTADDAYRGHRSLRVRDDSDSAQAVMICDGDEQHGADLRLQIKPEQLTQGVLLSLLGRIEGRTDSTTPVFHLWLKPDGSLWWFDGLAQDSLGWTQLGAAGTVRADRWNAVAVQVTRDMERALVYVGDHARPGKPHRHDYVGPTGPVGITPVAAITGFQLSSPGSATTGDSMLVDDIRFADGRHTAKPPRERVFSVSEPVTIDSTSEGFMQMPNTATVQTTATGEQEVLVGYPVHGDATHDTGTALAASVDAGQSWTEVDERNPFPDEQSFYLSALDDGTLLAVNYHTFMVEDSGEKQAVVPTAVSEDGGLTWQHREGLMTAPEAMRPISDATSRPGSRLGGFVLVHSVVEDDGTLYQSGYGYYENDSRYRSVLLASTDGGINWEVRSTVAVDPHLSDHPRYEGFGEAAFAITGSGDILAVMRTGNYQPLYQATSSDDGHSWSAAQPVVAGPNEIPVVGVFPDLLPMPDGTMVLWVGRPGQSLLASPDGEGQSWSTPTVVDYMNSGNGSLVSLGGDRILTFGDRGADWTPNTQSVKSIWAREVRLL